MTRRISYMEIENYRSIKEKIRIDFPENTPVILVGENNAGKSNIIRALDLILGETWPSKHHPEDHEFWGRVSKDKAITIQIGLDGVTKNSTPQSQAVTSILWHFYNREMDPEYRAFIQGGGEIGVNELIRDQVTVISVGANRNLPYQLSYSSKNTFLSKLSKKFHESLVKEDDRKKRLGEAFAELMEIFNEVGEFSEFQNQLKQDFQEMVSGMTHQLDIDFSAYDPRNYFHSLKVMPKEGSETRTFEELGTGEEQLLAFSFAHSYAKTFHGGVILVIEEPEAHLHPLAQQWLAKRIRKMAEDGVQVIITTHNPYFVDVMDLPGLAIITKTDDATKVRQLSAEQLAKYCVTRNAPPNLTNRDTVLPFYSSSSTYEILTGLFAKKIILVEGQTEQLALPIYFSKVGLETQKEGISIISVMGKGNLAKWWRFFTAYSIPTYIIFDNDSKDSDEDGTRRTDALKTIGVPDEKIAESIAVDDWIVDDNFTVFGKDFEKTFQSYFQDYKDIEKESEEFLGKKSRSSKPLFARFIAQKITRLDDKENDKAGWGKLESLKKKVLDLKL